MRHESGITPNDVALSAFIDDELPDAEADEIRGKLANDTGFARRYAEMIGTTFAIRAAYRDVVEVLGIALSTYARTIGESWRSSHVGGNPSASGRGDETSATVALRQIDFAVASLTSEQRSTLCFVVLEGCSYLEIAEALSMPRSTIVERIAEARSRLVATLGEAATA